MPMLVAVMLMVSVGTFNWQSVKELKIHLIGFNVVMLVTIAIVVYILGCDSCFRPR
ncbi:sulfate transporter [Bibersteinia trehalosi USDA-ARS-USMARC-189]|uniref:Sulfate transporter n=1 Tax=Bibersteinia trehalosi USDA-ARS-USMARC-189 TaxID=1263831 RepID=A0ABM5PEI1_BIBTR|nr:sulfate transporter [Bibersteinia trehalosi USDA-ARS-USMARC-192]AHG84757.1 sulfate transporter [Bibersteinia trehalosi USDA-ARS-USMARC-189]